MLQEFLSDGGILNKKSAKFSLIMSYSSLSVFTKTNNAPTDLFAHLCNAFRDFTSHNFVHTVRRPKGVKKKNLEKIRYNDRGRFKALDRTRKNPQLLMGQ